MKQKRTHLCHFVCCLVLALAAGCGGGDGAELVVVTVHGSRVGLTKLDVLVTLDGTEAMALEEFLPNSTDFGLDLPVGASGALEVAVAGVDASGCIVSIAVAQAQAGAAHRLDLTVTLGPVTPPKC